MLLKITIYANTILNKLLRRKIINKFHRNVDDGKLFEYDHSAHFIMNRKCIIYDIMFDALL